MSDRYVYSGGDALWVDTTKPWTDPDADEPPEEELFEEVDPGETMNDQAVRIVELEEENSSMADDICSLTTAHERAQQAEAELAFVKEWFENILPNDWDKCMDRWAERSAP